MEFGRLEAKMRLGTGKGNARRARHQGYVPGVLYGLESKGVPLQVSAKELDHLLISKGDNALVEVEIMGDKGLARYKTLIREVQRSPVKGEPVHVDLYQITMKDKLHTSVPVHLIGEPAGAKAGGILQHGQREIEIECLPADIPSTLDVNVAGMAIGDHLVVADIVVPAGVKIVSDPAAIIATVVASRLADVPKEPDHTGAGAAEGAGEHNGGQAH
ncbi:MAG: 50S ribosomal protein L25 [Bacillota bacterium]